MPKKIPLEISESELLVRCIGFEIYYLKKQERLTSTSYMPAPGRNDVSLLRLAYSSKSQCKQHGKSIKKGNYQYCGLAFTSARDLQIDSDDFRYENGQRAMTKLISSPLDKNKNIREDKEIFDSDDGLPYHADLCYNWKPTKGKNAPNVIKRIAKKLSKTPPTNFFKDNYAESDEWVEESHN